MAKLILLDETKADLFSFAAACETTEQARQELVARGWNNADALKHIDAALRAGAYATSDAPQRADKSAMEK